MNHIEITVEQHAAYVDAAADRDTLRAKLAEEQESHAETLQMFQRARDTRDTLRKQLADLNHKYAAVLNESAKADAKATIAKEDRDAAPLRIVLDQGPPTEPGWYLAEQEPAGRRLLAWFGRPHPGLRELFLRFSRRIEIVVPESEVGG